MNATVWSAGLQTRGAEILRDGKLGFIDPDADGFRVVPCSWSALIGVKAGPYPSRGAALQAVRSYLDTRATHTEGPDG